MNFTEVLEEFDAAIRFGCGDIHYNLENDIKEAIEKQIPKPTIGNATDEFPTCPTCCCGVLNTDKYCHNCGQALK